MANRVQKILWKRKNQALYIFADVLKRQIPFVAIVKNSSDPLLPSEQIVFVSELVSQTRVIATDSRGVSYSFPKDYQVPFKIWKSEFKGRKVSEIAEHLPSPETFKTGGSFIWSQDTAGSTIELDGLKFTEKREEEFFVVNRISNDGILDGRQFAISTKATLSMGLAAGFGPWDEQVAYWSKFLETLSRLTQTMKLQTPPCLAEIFAVTEEGLSDPSNRLQPSGMDPFVYPNAELDKVLPPEPPPRRPPKLKNAKESFSLVRHGVFNDTDYTLKDFFDIYSDDLPQIVMVTSGVYGLIDIETFGSEDVMRIETYDRQKRVIAIDHTNTHFSIPITYPVFMTVIEGGGNFSEPMTLEEIVESRPLPLKVMFDERANLTRGANSTAYKMRELELLDVYKETYYLGNVMMNEEMADKVIVMPIYLEVTVRVAESWTYGTHEEWLEFLEKLKEKASHLDYHIPTINKSISIYSPGQVNVGENIYEFITPETFLTLTSEDESSTPNNKGNINQITNSTGRGGYSTVTDPKTDYGNEYVKFGSSIRNKTLNHAMAPLPPAPAGAEQTRSFVPVSPPAMPSRSSKPKLSPSSPVSPDPKKGIKQAFKFSLFSSGKTEDWQKTERKSRIRRPTDPTKQATVAPFQHRPTKVPISPPITEKTCRPDNRSSIYSLEDIPKDIGQLTVEEVGDCLILLNLGEYVEAFFNLQVDGHLLKEFSAKDFQNDPKINMSVAQSKLLSQFAKKGWRPKHN